MADRRATDRRKFLLATATGVTGVAGCLRSPVETVTSPDIAVSDIAEPEPTVDHLDRTGDEYSAILENTGIGGDVRAELYFAESEAENPVLESSQQLQLDADEQSTVEFTADQPEWAVGFLIEAYGIRYVANIRNAGSEAIVNVQLVDLATDIIVEETEVTIPAERTKQVEFISEHRFEDEYEVRTSLIDW